MPRAFLTAVDPDHDDVDLNIKPRNRNQVVDDTASLLTSLTALTLLSLRGCRGISSAAPPLLGASLTSLRSLNISHCWRVNTIR